MHWRAGQRGIALREISLVLLAVAAISGVVAQRLAFSGAQAGAAVCEGNVARINVAIEKWFFDKGCWPADDLADIGCDHAYFPNGIPRCPVTGEPYTMDARSHRVRRHGH
jgi:hypothetical protein